MEFYMDEEQKSKYRISLVVSTIVVLILGIFLWFWQLQKAIPDRMILFEGKEESLNFSIPFGEISLIQLEEKNTPVSENQLKTIGEKLQIDKEQIQEKEENIQVSVNSSEKVGDNIQFSISEPVAVTADGTGSIQAQVKLFGWLHYKNIQIDIMEETRVMPVGKAVGLYIHADGVMVLGTGKVSGDDGMEHQPSYGILQSGDYIYKVNNVDVKTIEDVSRQIQKNGQKQVILEVNREGNRIRVKITPVLAKNGCYQIGAWLREDTEGIGTLSFVTENNQFAALGHGITDADTGLLIRLENGGLYSAEIDYVERGKNGSPGQLVGSVRLGPESRLGTIENNTSLGITGEVSKQEYIYDENKAMEMGRKQEVKEGEATILCQLGDRVKEYAVEIEKVHISSKDNKGIEIHVTDKELLKDAGGIVQGMSGAPLIQNGKCIGAVTHVFVKDVTRGYATFIENML